MKTFAIYDADGTHEYDLEVNEQAHFDTVYTLRYPNGGLWADHVKGEVALVLQDDGNGLKITFSGEVGDITDDEDHDWEIDYSDAEKINVMFRAIAHLNPTAFGKFTMLPTSDAIAL